MKVIGLTGGVGMGKSAAGSLLAQMGVSVVDTDALARELVEPGQPALNEIRDYFGPGVIDPSGRLARAELAQRVFSDPKARERLEAILHPRIRALWLSRIDLWRGQGVELGAILIPLLFETKAADNFDAVICV